MGFADFRKVGPPPMLLRDADSPMGARRASAQVPTNVDGPAPRHVPKLPLEAGRPRVQRLVDELAPVHLETEPPPADDWRLVVEGEVTHECAISLSDLRRLGTQAREIDFHCVWGWSRPRTRWAGVPLAAVLELAGPTPGAKYVTMQAQDSPYASCMPMADACAGLLAVELDGEELPAIHGGPLRWVQPHYMFGYKGVKWLSSLHLGEKFVPGFWEEAVGDVHGYVPDGVLAMFESAGAGGGATAPAEAAA